MITSAALAATIAFLGCTQQVIVLRPSMSIEQTALYPAAEPSGG